KPVIKGTRVPVDILLGKLAGGTTYEELIREYDLTRDQIFAALKAVKGTAISDDNDDRMQKT
ncbi:MAG: DUF433 domain-containing protein, partial [Bacillota bacterium]